MANAALKAPISAREILDNKRGHFLRFFVAKSLALEEAAA